ncbi:MAG: trypsin-like peptidase domain-containing protein [Candidatus Contendobacter sp.]|jgi:S1-C subfamily serine protease|nr:trypsin-like peptidase domain-containing protein [Gammaproteobacteria bacterium]MCC8992574.1 trypsin-like peptidase domain-containing protein [Candidatus Contendobacter sp.]
MNLRRTLAAVLLTLASATAVWAGQYDTIDYYVQQMIAAAATKDQAGVLTFREQLDNQRRPEPGDATQARPFRQQGLDHLAGNRFKEALAAFRQAFIADPADPEIANQLSLTYLLLRRLKEAERLAVYALSLAPGQSATWFTLGQVYGQTGDTQRAAGAFANAYQFAPDPATLTEQLRQLATTDPADAVRIGALQALQAVQPQTPPTSLANPGIPPVPTAAPPPQPAVNSLPNALQPGASLGKPVATPPPASSPPQPAPAGNDNLGQRIYRRSLPITCLIVTTRNGKTDNLGSGLLVSSDGLVITNDHVIDKADNLAVKCGGRESVAKIRRRGKSPDLALLSTSLNGADRFILNATYSQDLIGRDVFVIGNPYGLEGTFSTGVISGLREIDGVRYIQISAPISPGNSGGPVILHDGTVIGIATMGLKVGQNLNFAIAAIEISAAGFFDPSRMKNQPASGKP